MQEKLLDQKSSIDLIEYRLHRFEASLAENFSTLSDKLDKVITKLNESEIKQENLKIRVEKLEKEYSRIELEKGKISEDLVKIKVSVAEKLSWSAGGGIVGTVLIKLLEGLK